MTPREQHLDAMAYNAERDGYDRAWHRVYAAGSHRDLAILTRAADRAVRDQVEEEKVFAKRMLKSSR